MGFFVGTERKSWKWGKFDAAVEKCRPPGKKLFDATEMLTRAFDFISQREIFRKRSFGHKLTEA